MNAEAEVKLNLGAGEKDVPGYVSIDRKLGTEVFPLEVEDGSVDEIRASHVLEHFSHRDSSSVLNHWVQKLRPGGLLRIAVPDFEYIAREYLAGKPLDVQGYTYGSHTDPDDYHKAGFDRETLDEVMMNAGLERLHSWNSEIADCASLPASLNRGGYKPTAGDFKPDRVVACLSTARFGPTLHYRCLIDAISKTGIRGEVAQGAYWSQTLCTQMEKAIADEKIDHVITFDYDSIFTSGDIVELCRLARTSDEVDAICAVQSRRGKEHVLFTLPNGATSAPACTFDGHLTRVATGHFGCTIFRADALRTFDHPWMLAKPDKSGRWSDDSVDADMDFWHRWKDAGKSLHVANRVVIGHLEEMILWPGRDFKPVHQSVEDYGETGVPAEVQRCA